MGFLNNSGDIILDAVLTDAGRFRMAKGDGSFSIAKFALGDDEIDYGLYRNENHDDGAHPSGSAYYDLEILQTPVLEAFTNNTSNIKSRLISIPKTNLLYLPVMRINDRFHGKDLGDNRLFVPSTSVQGDSRDPYFIICVDKDTESIFKEQSGTKSYEGKAGSSRGALYGMSTSANHNHIRIEQGLDTADIPPENGLSVDLIETQYLIQMDDRLGKLIEPGSTTPAAEKFIDDDNVAHYFISDKTAFVESLLNENADYQTQGAPIIKGPRGTAVRFKIQASPELQFKSTTFFSKYGSTKTAFFTGVNVDIIDTMVRVTGLTTGYRVDIPVRYMKYKS